MALVIHPTWDPTETVSLRLCDQRRELVLIAGGSVSHYRLRSTRPAELGWIARGAGGEKTRKRPAGVAEVVCACLREWEAEEQVIELTRAAAQAAIGRGREWGQAGRRLAVEADLARSRSRVSAVPFQVLFRHRSDPRREDPLSASAAAERIGFIADGRPDTTRLKRRMGLADQTGRRSGQAERQRSVNYSTGLALCEAIGVEPTELGL